VESAGGAIAKLDAIAGAGVMRVDLGSVSQQADADLPAVLVDALDHIPR
jgi:hypothetical protein